MTQLPTISAIATPTGQGGVGIIRLSGGKAYDIGLAITGKNSLKPRHAHFVKFYGEGSTVIDEGVVIYFNAPHSFTGEDVVELQGHGGMVLQNLLLARTFELGARQAAAGEFSMRAFDNDKLDLVQAEAISDAISATTAAEAMSAIRSLSGEFSALINDLQDDIINLRLYVEASIDFSDEEDVDFLSDGVILKRLNDILQVMDAILATAKQGQILKDGVHVVLAGKPNAGKSSLLNRLAKTDRAIVTDIAGTTRDTLEETLVLNGLKIHLTDTAGLRDTKDKVEKIGIDRAKAAINQADILILVYDVCTDEDPIRLAVELFANHDVLYFQENIAHRLMLVANKCDLLDVSRETKQKDLTGLLNANLEWSNELNIVDLTDDIVYVSCETGEGIDGLSQSLCQKVGFYPSENSLIARTRHLDAISRAKFYADEAKTQLTVFHAGELVAESLRLSAQSLGEITGQVSSDELLGKIFSSFCIGK
ncbi:tRNA uridine-5-carboxymethylaminomethyl(34) synthesis GTPase MnmE [Moraxella nasovis]|uniref:tRNA uridine-5-carboxymethylaminomethyl(34) synthesis GTPase MnmE n=1 Tax=Moraxella nasovis TaxID=2904121 RepID=UPI001F61D8AA|nr:tRNA uridine-5-carboxymethylaminomethyl(34) synthesis GTPase MnmE [Moraxella nasovis]UNU72496.1 tRNA uridine-5-carboxymethylaminomethyl(34) synthesis GTPase MnmE [Moraxella nasovis]